MNFVTYAHLKPDGTMFYIGKGSLRRAYSSCGRNIFWNRTVKKHGGFNVEIIGRWETEKEAFDHEIFMIEFLKNNGIQLVNISKGGLGSCGFRHTDKHKASVRKMMLDRNPMSNPKVREKQIKKLKEAMSRPDVRKKQSLARIGMKFSSSHIESLKNCHPMKSCVINGNEYKSLMEASRQLKIRHGTLHRWLNNPDIQRGKKYSHITECRWL